MDRSQPSIDELTSRFLSRQLSEPAESSHLDVEPYDAVALQPVEPRLAWDGSLESIRYFTPNLKISTRQPTGWSRITSLNPSLVALPMAIGHFPQAVRDVAALLRTSSAVEATRASAIDDPGVISLVESLTTASDPVSWFVAGGILRTCGQLQSAAKLMETMSGRIPTELAVAWDNERATLAWMMGKSDEAKSIWASLPIVAPVAFNLGVAELFGGSAKAARGHFQEAISLLPESTGWHHLAQLYLAIAESR